MLLCPASVYVQLATSIPNSSKYTKVLTGRISFLLLYKLLLSNSLPHVLCMSLVFFHLPSSASLSFSLNPGVSHTPHTDACKDCYRTIFILKSCVSGRRKQAENKSHCSKARDTSKTRADFFPTFLFTTLHFTAMVAASKVCTHAHTHTQFWSNCCFLERAMEKVTCQRLKFMTINSDVSCFFVSKTGSNLGQLFMRKTYHLTMSSSLRKPFPGYTLCCWYLHCFAVRPDGGQAEASK